MKLNNQDSKMAKILKGIELSREFLIEKSKKLDEELIFADKAGNIKRVKARDL